MKKYFYIIGIAAISMFLFNSCSKDGNVNQINTIGSGGSLARFTIYDNYLYVVDGNNLTTYNIDQPNQTYITSTIAVGSDIETIYPYEGNLYIGSKAAMYIYSLENPEQPTPRGVASHLRACDPVVVKNENAFVTVRSSNNGSSCGGTINALMIYNVHNVDNPIFKKTVSLSNPYGLGIQDDYLYVCDGNMGLKIFNISNPYQPDFEKSITGFTFYDIIPYQNLLVCMVDGGMVIYNATDPRNPEFVAKTF